MLPLAAVGVVTRPLPRLRLVDRPLVLKDRLGPLARDERQFVDGSRGEFQGPGRRAPAPEFRKKCTADSGRTPSDPLRRVVKEHAIELRESRDVHVKRRPRQETWIGHNIGLNASISTQQAQTCTLRRVQCECGSDWTHHHRPQHTIATSTGTSSTADTILCMARARGGTTS